MFRKYRLPFSILFLAFFLILSGCGGASPGTQAGLDPDDPITLEIWHYYNGPQKSAFDNMVSEFNETVGLEEGIVIEPFSQGNVGALGEKVLASANGDAGAEPLPAIFAAYADTAYEVAKLDKLADLDAFFTMEELDAYRPEFVAEGRFSSALTIFPIAKSVELLMLNNTDWEKFEAATGTQRTELATFEGITRTAEAYYNWTDGLTAVPNDGKALFGRDAMANYMIIGCRQFGLELFTEQNGTVTVHTDPAVLRKLWDNYYVPMVNGWFSSTGRFRSDAANLGDIIALVGSSSAASYFPGEVTINDFEHYPIQCLMMSAPRFAEGEAYSIQQGAGMSVTRGTPAQEYASALFLKWFTQPERNIRFSTASGGYLPVTIEALDMERIDQTLVAMYPDPVEYQLMYDAFSASMEEISGCTLYTPPPFEGNMAARQVLESSLNDLAKQDRQSVLDLIAQGTTPDEAVASINTAAHFEAWTAQLTAELEQATQSATE